MILRNLNVENFRNFSSKKYNFCDSINVVYGLNGFGKSNLLEAISVVCLSKSFRTRNDANLIQFQKDNFRLTANIYLDSGIEKNIQIYYDTKLGKQIRIDHSKIESLSELIGSFPIVILTPEDDSITSGPPFERRRFINFVLSQLDKDYFKLLQEYVRILKQRNKILQDAKKSRYKFLDKIEPWDEELFHKSKAISLKRKEFLKDLELYAIPIHKEITSYVENFSISYKPNFDLDLNDYQDFKKVLEKNRNLEIIRGSTIIGPHLDEITFFIDEHEVRKYASRGQHRCCLLSLKIAEFKILRDKKLENPIFLLDDVYSEIDEIREKAVTEYFLELKQIFLSTHQSDISIELKPIYNKKIEYINIQSESFEDKVLEQNN